MGTMTEIIHYMNAETIDHFKYRHIDPKNEELKKMRRKYRAKLEKQKKEKDNKESENEQF